MKNILITGATGMVGKGVLLEALSDESINQVVLLSRSSVNLKNPKIKEILIQDFHDLASIENELPQIDACMHCMGVSVIGLSEEQYNDLTFNITKQIADLCYKKNPNMVFSYVSGQGTDESEKGSVMWARVKGKAENYIKNRGFKKAFLFRPGMIIPEKGIKSKTAAYNLVYIILRPFFYFLKKSKNITTTTVLGQAMLNTLNQCGEEAVYLDNKAINELGKS